MEKKSEGSWELRLCSGDTSWPVYCKPPCTVQASNEGYPWVDVLAEWPDGYNRTGLLGKTAVWEEAEKDKRREGCQQRREEKEGRKEGGDQWRILKSWFGFSVSCCASQARKQTPYVMLTLPAWWTGLKSVPALLHPAALYPTPGHPFLALQKLSKPTHPNPEP